MPFVSKSQQRLMFKKHPKIAKRWAKEYGVDKDMPEKVGHEKKENERKKYGISNLKRKP